MTTPEPAEEKATRAKPVEEKATRAKPVDWLAARGQKPFPFQRTVWAAMRAGKSGLLHATTGAGKTYAVWLGALQAFAGKTKQRTASTRATQEQATAARRNARLAAPPLTVLWLTPMRALAADTARALMAPLPELAPDWTCGIRTGDTSSSERAAQTRRLPTTLITTPESVSLLLSRADAEHMFSDVRLVVVDEWHELMGNKRGVQTQLALARLTQWNPSLQIWGLSATLGNLDDALDALLPRRVSPTDTGKAPPDPLIVRGQIAKTLVIDTLLPTRAERFAWAGHMGLQMVPQVIEAIDAHASTLVFTNTRSQAERWYQALIETRPDYAGQIAIHHGSLDRAVREWVELSLKEGRLKAVVATSSLDLGVDFLPVERVLQIGSCKGIARLMQRGGRSGHAPGRASRITLVPTHSLELVEAAAARAAVEAGRIENRPVPRAPLDVLVQHLVTIALGGGFRPEALLAEVRSTASYRELSDEDWQWCLDFIRFGGPSLTAYPDFRRVAVDEDGVWRVPDARLARRHRANIGTIVSDAAMSVQFMGGGRLGSVEESFIARLRPGDVFTFAGRLLELVRVEQMTAFVRKAAKGAAALPRWNGGRMPLSNTLADAVLEILARYDTGGSRAPEMQAVAPLLAIQQQRSLLPTPDIVLAETLKSREGWHLFVYPFAGRLVHMGLAGLLAWRAGQQVPATFSIGLNDYGFELLSATPVDFATLLPKLLAETPERDEDRAAGQRPRLLSEVLASLNAGELAKRRFREIARIAGLIFQSHPGEHRSARQLQASAGLYYEVFVNHDADNRLLRQAQTELLQHELDIERLADTLRDVNARRLQVRELAKPSPLAFPLMVERFRETLSTESLATRIARMVNELERDAGGELVGTEHAPASARDDAPLVDALRLGGASEKLRAERGRKRTRRIRKDGRAAPPAAADEGTTPRVPRKPRLARRPKAAAVTEAQPPPDEPPHD